MQKNGRLIFGKLFQSYAYKITLLENSIRLKKALAGAKPANTNILFDLFK